MINRDERKILVIDLTNQKTTVEPLNSSYLRKYLGGAGLGVRLLLDYSLPGADPLGPENPIIFAASTLGGTMVPTATKHAVVTRSPLTGMVGDSLSSGDWSLALKRTGFDAIVITGAAPDWTYLFIDDEIVHFRRAVHLVSMGCGEVEETICREIGDRRVKVSSIGVGGENLVRYACISNDNYFHAGRTGTGAVMGAKKLKAVAVRGTKPVYVSDLARLEEVCSILYRKSQGEVCEKYRNEGTPANIIAFDRLGALPTRNFQQSTFEQAEKVSGENLRQHYLAKVVACVGCPIACKHIYQVTDGPYAGIKVNLYYEGLYALGPLCGIDDVPAILKEAQLCDIYGIDSISTGSSIAWAMECFERGVLSNGASDGLELAFGNYQAAIEMIGMIARRQDLGDLLAKGVRRAAAEIGQGSEHWAMHSKGLELPGYDPRAMKTMALGFAVGTRGGCHNRLPAYELDVSGKVDRLKGEWERGPLAMEQENFSAVLDSLIMCKFLRRCFDDFYSDAAELYHLVTGWDVTPQELKQAGERITNLKKLFNIGQDWSREDDWLPPRVFHDPLPTGASQGSVLTEEELNTMIDGYFEARGWTREGLIPEEKLRELGMGGVAEAWRRY